MTKTKAVLLASAGLAALAPSSVAQGPSVLDVLTRATDYVVRLNDQLSGTVAEERYEQRARTPSRSGFGGFPSDRDEIMRRTLRSD